MLTARLLSLKSLTWQCQLSFSPFTGMALLIDFQCEILMDLHIQSPIFQYTANVFLDGYGHDLFAPGNCDCLTKSGPTV